MFPDAEGWENVDPDEVAKWSMGSDFPPHAVDQSQTEAGTAAEMPTGMVKLTLLECTSTSTGQSHT